MSKAVLIVPGFGGSGPLDWQTLWQRSRGYARVEQADWERPDVASWTAALERDVAAAAKPVVLVAHSLGCALVAHFARSNPTSPVVGALLVAPADVDSELHTPDEVRGFSPLPLAPLPFRSIVVGSRTDPYVRFARAQEMASRWGARFVDVGRLGHVNADSDVGEWEDGHRLLGELIDPPG